MKNKTKNTIETYTISRGLFAASRPGRKPSVLGNTIRNLNVGDGFVYPHTFAAAKFNLQRAASTYGIELDVHRGEESMLAVRTA